MVLRYTIFFYVIHKYILRIPKIKKILNDLFAIKLITNQLSRSDIKSFVSNKFKKLCKILSNSVLFYFSNEYNEYLK